jgi:hypothetical protein
MLTRDLVTRHALFPAEVQNLMGRTENSGQTEYLRRRVLVATYIPIPTSARQATLNMIHRKTATLMIMRSVRSPMPNGKRN